ncbi:MAG: ferredoxin-NADPH reductase [Pseudolysinimonas sp.]|uniref:ferredoxin-NADPH reductase n=1 Tax=Pseudolysinimonas sp. TaxID=2680009 RepID=UPI003266436D
MRFEKIQNAMDALATALVVNLLLAVSAAPLILLLVFTNAFETWALVALTAVIATPGLTGAFSAFRDADGRPFRAFLSGYRATWTRAIRIGFGLLAGCAVVVVDAKFFADGPFAQAAMVVLAVVIVLVVGTGLVALAAIAEDPKIRLRDAVRRAAWSCVRYWYLTLASLAVLVVFAVLFVNIPLLAISAGASPILYVAWANSRFSLRAAPVAPVAAKPVH